MRWTPWCAAGRALAVAMLAAGACHSQPTQAFPGQSDPGAPPPDASAPQASAPGQSGYEPYVRPAPVQTEQSAQPCPEQPGFAPYRRYPGCGDPPDGPPPIFEEREILAGPYVHDGFYFRVGFGVGMGRDSAKTVPSDIPGNTVTFAEEFHLTLSGLSAGTEVAIGYSLVPGLVVAVAVDTATFPTATASGVDLEATRVDYEFKVAQLALYSLMVDYYPLPRRGLHVQMAGGLAVHVSGQGDPKTLRGPRARAHTSVGWGIGAGVGYEFWVGQEWSIGALGRFLYAKTSGTDPESHSWRHKTLSPALLLTGTYH